ncbi:bifunctional Armadillo-like helical/Armadillo-type fold/Exportin 4-7-like [Babesia duncani]|uniref:Bifunctional Armadillo-like helical/Armadillo-type fold/Exportin 4-7-like n=1 Tax=Babesia duncani TaxID=323732 RepID=A0AAD9UQV1_9APIC|nr:bifunctional Armadillo-like helical/Armadillo-type fold/Exportin 4-7-like [Babesia duncani]
MEVSELQQIELLCQALYGGQPAHQNEAHEVLMPLLGDVQKIPLLREILANSSNLQALLFASSGLVSLFTSHWSQVSDVQKKELREFLLNYLYNRGPEMLKCAHEVLGQFIRLYCRIVKLGWLEEANNQSIITHVNQFLAATTQHWIIGLSIYTNLTLEMQPQMGKFVAKLRRGALNFKETVFPEIFQVTIKTLDQFHSGTALVADAAEETRLLQQILQLCNNCLSFDFMATMPDDTSEEQATVMIPQGWDALRSDKIPRLLFDLYAQNCVKRPACAVLCLKCLVVVAALRKSFFNSEAEALGHLNAFMLGTLEIIRSRAGLSNDDCYHELCRLLGKINAANQLSQLLQSNAFPLWTEQLHSFTMEALRNWQHMPNSIHYLLGVWAHMVVPLAYMRGKVPSLLETNIFQVTLEFVASRFAMAEAIVKAGDDVDFENPLEHEILRLEQADLFSKLCRCQYRPVVNHILDLFKGLDSTSVSMDMHFAAIKQEKLAWLVLLSGAMLNGSCSLRLTGDDPNLSPMCLQTLNIDLVGQCFTHMAASDAMAQENPKLELAYLHFLTHFRKFFISEHTKGTISGDIRERFAQIQGCPPGMDGTQYLLNRLVEKVFFNLQNRFSNETVVKKTLALFNDLSSGIDIVHYADRSPHLIVSARLILQCETLRMALLNHAEPFTKFLSIPQYGKYRTMYYSILTKLLLLDISGDDNASESILKFEAFMGHHQRIVEQLWNYQYLAAPECKSTIIGLMRDLKGVCKSCVSVEAYQMFFNWIVNAPKQPGKSRIHLLTKCTEACWADHEIMVPLIKCLAEILDNRGRRISFDKTSANGILLFKDSAKIVMLYGVKLLQMSSASSNNLYQSSTDTYKKVYKGLAACLEVLNHTLGGDYVSFGVFDVYGDTSLEEVLKLAFELCLAIPLEDLQSYPKAMQPYFRFLDLCTRMFMPNLLQLTCKQIAQLISTCSDGLCCFEASTSLSAASTLDNFTTYCFTQTTSSSKAPETSAVVQFLEMETECLKRTMILIFHLLLRGDSNSAWSMSRPLLGLILLNQVEFQKLPQQLAANMPEEKQAKLHRCFAGLMNGIENNLTPQNKDIFTKNVYMFSQEARVSFV